MPAAPDAGEVRTRLLRASSRAAAAPRADGAPPSAPMAIAWRTEKRTDPRVIRAGAVGLAVTWAVTASGGLMWALGVGADRIVAESIIPIAGPFVVAAELSGMGGLGISTTLFMLAGLAQTATLVTLIVGLTLERPVKVPVVELGRGEDAPRLTLVPALVDGRAPGVSLVGWNF